MGITRLRSDNGAEITGTIMTEWRVNYHIDPETTVPNQPDQKGTADVTAGNSPTVSSSMQITVNTPAILQGYAIHYATYIQNRLFSAALSRGLSVHIPIKNPTIATRSAWEDSEVWIKLYIYRR
jgi:hypothetical protein